MEILHFLFLIFGNVAALFLFHSPLTTFRKILRSKSTEQLSRVLYTMTLLNCFLSAWCGLPFVSPHNILVSTINFSSAAIETLYVLIFIVYAVKKARSKALVVLVLLVTVFTLVVLVSLLALDGQGRNTPFYIFEAPIFSICMYAAPLAIMRHVILRRSSRFMPIFLSLIAFLCGTSWFMYGVLGCDLVVAVPNGFGCALAALQLMRFAVETMCDTAMQRIFRRVESIGGTICYVAYCKKFGILIGTESRGIVRDPITKEIIKAYDRYRKIVVFGDFFIVNGGGSQIAEVIFQFVEDNYEDDSSLLEFSEVVQKGIKVAKNKFGKSCGLILGSAVIENGKFRDQEFLQFSSDGLMNRVSVGVIGRKAVDAKSWKELTLEQAQKKMTSLIIDQMERKDSCGGPIEMISLTVGEKEVQQVDESGGRLVYERETVGYHYYYEVGLCTNTKRGDMVLLGSETMISWRNYLYGANVKENHFSMSFWLCLISDQIRLNP